MQLTDIFELFSERHAVVWLALTTNESEPIGRPIAD